MGKVKKFLIVDTETATMFFADEIAQGDAEKKKRIAIARPLIYDAGWTITNRRGEILEKKQFLVAETFCVPAIFDTAYYKEKKKIYLEMLKKGETTIKPWNEIMEIFMQDCEKVDAVGAFNSMFDFKKAIPFTELYISKLYSPDYYSWEKTQRALCEKIANGETKKEKNPNFEADVFRFRGKVFPLFDLWGLSVKYLLNNVTYKSKCLEHNLLTASGTFFKSSAETTYKYLCNKYDFVESHTALDDAEIETFILSRIAARHKIETGIEFFPFRNLGYTYDFVNRRKKPIKSEVQIVYDAMKAYYEMKELCEQLSTYTTQIRNKMAMLEAILG